MIRHLSKALTMTRRDEDKKINLSERQICRAEERKEGTKLPIGLQRNKVLHLVI